MKHTSKILTVAVLAGTLFAETAFAGNQDRAGQAGASELLLNPWARTSGWAGSNVAGVRGLEGQFLNVAGTAFTKKTELLFSHTNYLKGALATLMLPLQICRKGDWEITPPVS
jgi:hypothetical protein